MMSSTSKRRSTDSRMNAGNNIGNGHHDSAPHQNLPATPTVTAAGVAAGKPLAQQQTAGDDKEDKGTDHCRGADMDVIVNLNGRGCAPMQADVSGDTVTMAKMAMATPAKTTTMKPPARRQRQWDESTMTVTTLPVTTMNTLATTITKTITATTATMMKTKITMTVAAVMKTTAAAVARDDNGGDVMVITKPVNPRLPVPVPVGTRTLEDGYGYG
ncbi:hypothetical protein EDB85DRAFT_2238981 [Lactarius pseudohatsudake]|nr:hypothetical protein EDB85DRAFT_2238981 [Lactarius pseudohatsudake]